MMERWVARAESAATARAGEILDAVEDELGEVRGIAVERDGDTVRVSGRGLMRRWLADPRLRFALRGGR